jgi:uncharacterized protein YecE (DUF72 family)
MKVYVGTSGWSYSWNQGGDLSWFVQHADLNAVELNMSFYRFPRVKTIESWREKGKGLRWSIKVHRSVTHQYKFNEKAFEIWERFQELFSPMNDLIDFFLFQAPPRFRDADRIRSFMKETGLGKRGALELRDPKLLGDDSICDACQEHITMVSVDSPDFQNRIFPEKTMYMRMHGREDWYHYQYTTEELKTSAALLIESAPDCVYVFFNNNHDMLNNAREMREILSSLQ